MRNGIDHTPPLPPDMVAARVSAYGGIEAVDVMRIAVPNPGPGQVLVEVHAAGVGPWDAWVRSGKSTLPQPLPLTLGADLSGVVVALGPGVSGFAPGDAVFGVTNPRFVGAQAEYAVAEAGMLARKSPSIGFVEAAAIPVVAVTAWSALFDHGKLQLGQRVVIHGAAGNVGGYAVQMAKRAGAYVIGTGLGRDVAAIRKLGADEAVDVEAGPFVATVKYADLVIDTVGGVTQTASFDVVVPGGRLVSSVSEPDAALARARHVHAVFFLVQVTRARLEAIAGMLDRRQLKVSVGDVLPLAEVRTAHEMLAGKAHRPGKIVLAIRPGS